MALQFQLDNGLTVVFGEQHAARVVAVQAWVKVGGADEREDEAGLAHLHEHMLFKGTARRGPGDIAAAVEASGGNVNAWTSFDHTVYHVVMASRFARMGFDVLSDALRHSTFDAEELKRESEVVCEEIKRSADTPARRASRDLYATAFTTHPYRRPVIGWEETVRGFTREKVVGFYTRHYAPENIVLVVTGDLDAPTARALAAEYFGGDWGRPRVPHPPRPVEPPRAGRRVHLRQDDAKEAIVHVSFPLCASDHPDVPALDVLAMLVGQGDSSRMSLEVKRRRQLVRGVHCSAYTPKDPGLFTLTLTLQPEKLAEALDVSLALLLQAREELLDAAELETVKALVEAEGIYQRETVQGLAEKLGYHASGAGGLEAEAKYRADVAALTPEHLRDVASRWLDVRVASLTALLPNGTAFTEADAHAALQRAENPQPVTVPARRLPPAHDGLRSTGAKPGARDVDVRLSCGTRLLVRPEPGIPLAALRGAFVGGTRHETEATCGLHHLLARTLPRGTPSLEPEQVSHLLDDMAGSLSAAAGRNSLSLRAEFLSRHLGRALELFADTLLRPALLPAELERERKLVLQDISTREDKPSGLAFHLFHQALFQRHPYRMQVGGEEASVRALTREQLAAHHARLMTPQRLTLAVVGDVDVDEVVRLAETHLGKAPSAAGGAEPTVADEPRPAAPRVNVRELQRAQVHLVYGFRGVTLRDPRRRALEVLSTVLSGQGGRLFVELRDKKSLAYSLSSYSVEGLDPGFFAVYVGTSPEKVPEALAGIREELRRVRDERIPEAELDRARLHIIGTHEIGLQRNGARAGLLALEAAYGLPLEDVHAFSEQVLSVTADDARAVAEDLLRFDQAALGAVGPGVAGLQPPSA